MPEVQDARPRCRRRPCAGSLAGEHVLDESRVAGSVCSTPRAPASRRRVWKPDSIHASARTRCVIDAEPRRPVRRASRARRPRAASLERPRVATRTGGDAQLLADHDRLRRIDACSRERARRPSCRSARAIAVSESPDAHDVAPTTATTADALRAHGHAVALDDRRERARADDRVRRSGAAGAGSASTRRPSPCPGSRRARRCRRRAACSRNCSTETSQPKSPRRSVREPKSGRPSGPSASACAMSATPTGRACWRWKAWTAAAVCGPAIPSICAEVEPVRAQRDLQAGDLRVDACGATAAGEAASAGAEMTASSGARAGTFGPRRPLRGACLLGYGFAGCTAPNGTQ